MMKHITLVIILIIISTTTNYGQILAIRPIDTSLQKTESVNSFASPVYNSKGKKLKKVGIILGASGVILIGGGIALMADAGVFSTNYFKDKKWQHSSAQRTGERYAGGAMVDIGKYAAAAGVIFFIVGNKKAKREKAALNFTLTPVSAGVGLSF